MNELNHKIVGEKKKKKTSENLTFQTFILKSFQRVIICP